jgi:selenophosphate synthetase-related protein
MNTSNDFEKIQLKELIQNLRKFPGILRKQDVGALLALLPSPRKISDAILADFGEDSALITQNSEDRILFHSDAIVESLVERNPYRAGMNCVLVNVNDIFAAAGQPVALTCVISYKDGLQGEETAHQLMAGAAHAVKLFQVPIVGGHTAPKCSYNAISMACVGIGKKTHVLQSSTAQPGDLILHAIDLVGQRGSAYPLGWDSYTFKSSAEVLAPRHAIMEVGKRHLATASKDSSIPGILGTTVMLLEASGYGGVIQVDAIPRPESVALSDWVKMFLSTGFVLTCRETAVNECRRVLTEGGLSVEIVGHVLEGSEVYLTNKQGENALFFDLLNESIFGKPLDSRTK